MSEITASTIAAQAFIFLELSPISSFSDETPQATQAGLFFPRAYRSCLAHADWSFARRLANLPAAELPADQGADLDLPYTFVLPSDCVKLRAVLDPWARWRLDEGYLRADQPAPLLVRYTRQLENEAQLPDEFQTAVALKLAILLAPKWLGTRTKIAELKNDLSITLAEAARQDGATASVQTYHGRGDEGDWATEARR